MAFPAGAVVGILGGGQLGRMTALAAARLGYPCHIFCPETGAPATQVTDRHTTAGYGDKAALKHFADEVDVITYEFENIPLEAVEYLASLRPVHPRAETLAICQDRLAEKNFVTEAGIGTCPYRAVDDLDDLKAALAEIGTPSILKTRRFGYDGKGQVRIDHADEASSAWSELEGVPAILEGFVPFQAELSVIAARGGRRHGRLFPFRRKPARQSHSRRQHGPGSAAGTGVASGPIGLGRSLIERFDMVGLLAVELFLSRDDTLLVNEMAPRPHNSGHWTQDGCTTDQFEQLIRCVTGHP